MVMSDAWKEDVRKDSFGEDLKLAIPVFQINNDSYIKCIEDIINSPSVHQDTQQLNRLMPGYLHMLINRIFVSNQRKTELVIYDYLFRYYESKMMREKKVNHMPEPTNITG